MHRMRTELNWICQCNAQVCMFEYAISFFILFEFSSAAAAAAVQPKSLNLYKCVIHTHTRIHALNYTNIHMKYIYTISGSPIPF